MKFYIIAMVFSLLLSMIGQLMLKRGMNAIGHVSLLKGDIFKVLIKMFTNISIILGGIIFVGSLAMWLVVLSKLDISYAYPIVSINYAFVALSSRLFFKEKISLLRWVSILVICSGVVLVSLS